MHVSGVSSFAAEDSNSLGSFPILRVIDLFRRPAPGRPYPLTIRQKRGCVCNRGALSVAKSIEALRTHLSPARESFNRFDSSSHGLRAFTQPPPCWTCSRCVLWCGVGTGCPHMLLWCQWVHVRIIILSEPECRAHRHVVDLLARLCCPVIRSIITNTITRDRSVRYGEAEIYTEPES